MKSGHRLDIIEMALEYVYQKSIERLGKICIYITNNFIIFKIIKLILNPIIHLIAANNLFKRYQNGKKIENESLEKLNLFKQKYNANFELIEETIEKQKTSEYGM